MMRQFFGFLIVADMPEMFPDQRKVGA